MDDGAKTEALATPSPVTLGARIQRIRLRKGLSVRDLAEAARCLYHAGARCLAICTNTMHTVADAVEAAVPPDAPLLHIGDATGHALHDGAAVSGRTLAFALRHRNNHARRGRSRVRPRNDLRRAVSGYLEEITARLRREQGAEAIVLGCTELMLIAGEQTGAFPLPRFDTTTLHARAIADYALGETDAFLQGDNLPCIPTRIPAFAGATV